MKNLSKNILVVACPSLLVATLFLHNNTQNQTSEHHFEQMYAIESLDSDLSDMCDGYSVELVTEIHWEEQRVSEYILSCNSQFDYQGKGFDGYPIVRKYHLVSELGDSEVKQPKRNSFLYIQREGRYGDEAYYKLDNGYGNVKLSSLMTSTSLCLKILG